MLNAATTESTLPCRYFYFGSATSELITADLAERSPFSGRSLLVPGLTLDRFVNVCIALNAWTTYPVLVVVLQVRSLLHMPLPFLGSPYHGSPALILV